MRQKLIRPLAGALVALWCLTSWPLPATAQSKPRPNYGAAIANAAREISKDPCNASEKFPALIANIETAAQQDSVGTDAPFMVDRMANFGCSNSKLTLSRTELLLNAGRQWWIDSCAYSPARDYSVELAMSSTSYNPKYFKLSADDLAKIPCARAFIAAVLTNQPMPPAIDPAPTATEQTTTTDQASRRRRARQ